MRLSNLGFGELGVLDVSTSSSSFDTFFSSPVTIPALGFVDLFVEFSPSAAGQLAETLTVSSDDLQEPVITVPLFGDAVSAPGQ